MLVVVLESTAGDVVMVHAHSMPVGELLAECPSMQKTLKIFPCLP
jgi:hypothetical protein